MRRLGWILLLLAGCLSKPPRPADVPTGPECTNPTITDSFDDSFAPVCGVGFSDENPNSTIERSGGVLHQRPGANIANDASCSWASFDFSEGAFVELRKPLNTGGSYTILQYDITDDQGVIVENVSIAVLDENGPELQMSEALSPNPFESEPYDGSEMRWLRLRPSDGRVAGEYSKDGESWRSLGAGVYVPLADPGEAEFDNFNICP